DHPAQHGAVQYEVQRQRADHHPARLQGHELHRHLPPLPPHGLVQPPVYHEDISIIKEAQMTEWTIVSVLAVLVGLLVSILKPIINLTRELSRLTTAVTELEKKVESLTAKSSDGRQRIWNHIEE